MRVLPWWILLASLIAATAAAEEEPEDELEEDEPTELILVTGLMGGTSFEGVAIRGPYGARVEMREGTAQSVIAHLYGELWFHEYLGAGLLVDAAWVGFKTCGFCPRRWWGGAAAYAVTGTDIYDDVGFFWRLGFGVAIGENDDGAEHSPGFYFGTWAGFRWFLGEHFAGVLSFGLTRHAVGQTFWVRGNEYHREISILEGRAQLGVELIL